MHCSDIQLVGWLPRAWLGAKLVLCLLSLPALGAGYIPQIYKHLWAGRAPSGLPALVCLQSGSLLPRATQIGLLLPSPPPLPPGFLLCLHTS